MGLFQSSLSDRQCEILRHSVGLKPEELRPLLGSIPTYIFNERVQFQKHTTPNTIAFLVLRGEYIINAKSTFGGKTTHHC
jgi:hypothetical protein